MQQQQATQFVTENTALKNNSNTYCSIRCPSLMLLTRFFLRNSIPLMLGMAAGVGTNWLEETMGLSEHVSDVVSCATTLVMAYGMDWMLEKCWPINPYSPGQSIFSVPNTNSVDTNIQVDQEICATI